MSIPLTVAMIGNPNVGKTALFNNLTGSRQHVANWPGVTIEKKQGQFLLKEKNLSVKVVDLPGTYSLSPHSVEEIIARDYISEERPDILINVVDASSIERNLYLTLQLLELDRPMVIALNMVDVAEKNRLKIDIPNLSKLLGVPVVPVVAIKKMGKRELIDQVLNSYYSNSNPKVKFRYPEIVEKKIEDITRELSKHSEITQNYPLRWLAFRLLEGDSTLMLKLKRLVPGLDFNYLLNGEAISIKLIESRYGFVAQIVHKVISQKEQKGNNLRLTDQIDKVIVNRMLGIPIFLLIMWAIFLITFDLVGNPLVDLMDNFLVSSLIPNIHKYLEVSGFEPFLISLISEGIVGGLGGVLIFVPQIFLLFFCISLLEDSGYMARAAYIMDRTMKKVGLSGKAFIPMLLGFGCSVPAIMTARTLDKENDRKLTMLLTPFMSCNARLPVYLIFVAVFFPTIESKMIFSLYFLGIIVAILIGLILRKFFLKDKVTPLILELPPYRLPSLRNAIIRMWERGKLFLLKAGTIILSTSIIIWVLSNFSVSGLVEMEHSLLASLGKIIAPVFAPLGFGNWQAAVAVLSGFLAKEVVISTMGIVYGIGELVNVAQENQFHQLLRTAFSPLSAYCFMVFILLYTPCIATLATIKRETNSYIWPLISSSLQFSVAWIVAFIFYQAGQALGY
ncbi:MAG: ferrous iron transport protein B [Bacillota bacterium]